jgi:hypothetical protein
VATVTKKPGEVQLYQSPDLLYYDSAHQGDMEERLRRNDRVTSTNSLLSVDELQLDNYGKTVRGGYEYTTTSFQQLCRILAAGTSTFIRDLTGKKLHRDGRDRLSDNHFALRTFNDVVALRFPLLTSYRVIRDEESKLIDGVIGPKHFALENSALYDQALSAVAATSEENQATFYSGVLLGRKMFLWYRSRRPFLSEWAGEGDAWRFYAGYFFCNGEARGTSARGTMAIFCKQGVCLGPYRKYGDRVSHIGRDFHRRLDKMFGKILSKQVPVAAFRDGMHKMLAESMGCCDPDKKKLVARIRTLARALATFNIPHRIALQIVDDALYVGRKTVLQEDDTPRAYNQNQLFATRTSFDLFACLVRSAGQMNLSRREVLEQAAWQMLAGEFNP